jgi:predicted MFS family arabinose efflux permease
MMAASALAFALLATWGRRERSRGRDPLIETSVFRHRGYSAGLATILVFFAGMIGTLLVLTLFLQLGQHFSAIHAGLTLAPFALGTAVGATLAGAVLVPRFGRTVLQVACLVLAGGVLWLQQTVLANGVHTDSLMLAGPELAMGIGIGLLISPLFDFILASVTDAEVGSASGVLNAVQQLGGAIGVAGIGTLFFSTVPHAGYVTALSRSLLVELAITPVLLMLISLLPSRARPDEPAADFGDQRDPAVVLDASSA